MVFRQRRHNINCYKGGGAFVLLCGPAPHTVWDSGKICIFEWAFVLKKPPIANRQNVDRNLKNRQ